MPFRDNNIKTLLADQVNKIMMILGSFELGTIRIFLESTTSYPIKYPAKSIFWDKRFDFEDFELRLREKNKHEWNTKS